MYAIGTNLALTTAWGTTVSTISLTKSVLGPRWDTLEQWQIWFCARTHIPDDTLRYAIRPRYG